MASEMEKAQQPTLTLVIDNREPLTLGAVATLMDALAKDYRQITGRQLTLRAARQGSLILILQEVVADAFMVMGAVVTMKEFAKIIRDLIGKARGGNFALGTSRARGIKTTRETVKVCRVAHADIEFIYERGDERLSVKMTRNEAEQAFLADQQSRPSQARASVTQALRRPSAEYQADRAIEDFAKTAALLSDDPVVLGDAGNAAFALARVLVLDLRGQPGGRDRLSRILASLRAGQHLAAARLLERLANE